MNSKTLASSFRRFGTLMALLLISAASPKAQGPDSRAAAARPPASASAATKGYYYALVIGIDNYPNGMPKLKTAVRDATSVAGLLKDRYGFIVKLLTDGQATHDAILQALVDYQSLAGENDSLLIYYAGHGFSDESANKAYWLPADANSSLSPHRIIADELTEDLRSLRARHVLVISDSCYSGGLSRSGSAPVLASKDPAFLQKMMAAQSRHLMASGGEEPVADGGPDGHSVFAAALLKVLSETEEPMFSASSIFYDQIMPLVATNAQQSPQYSPIRNANTKLELGDFIFTQKILKTTATTPSVVSRVAAPSTATRGVPAAGNQAPTNNTAQDVYNLGSALYTEGKMGEAEPYLIVACKGGVALACGALGSLYENGKGVTENQPRAASYFKNACDGGVMVSCSELGYMLENGMGVKKNMALAVNLYGKACDGGAAIGCGNLGVQYRSGNGVPIDKARAVALYRQACKGGEANGCSMLGDMYLNGEGVPQDEKRAAAVYLKACDSDDARGCDILGDLYHEGRGVTKDDSQAVALYEKACKMDPAVGCTDLGEMVEDGVGVDKDNLAAAKLYGAACDAEDADGCKDLADMFMGGKGIVADRRKALELYRKACDGDNEDACAAAKKLQR